jgi:hypothetical protein
VRIIGQLSESIATISSRHARFDAFWTIAADIVQNFQRDLALGLGRMHRFQANLGIINLAKSKELPYAIWRWCHMF